MTTVVREPPIVEEFPLNHKASLDCVVTTRSDGSELKVPLEVVIGDTRKPKLVAFAGVHGYEFDGLMALQDLCKEINPAKLSGTLLLIPAANPDAVQSGQRASPEDNLDLNRIFPGNPDGSISEQLAHYLFQHFVMDADMVVSFHGWPPHGITIPYVEFSDGIGSAEVNEASFKAARAAGFGIVCAFLDKRGLLLPEAVRAGVPAIEPEIGGLGISDKRRRKQCRQAMLNLMQYMKMWPGDLELEEEPIIVRDHGVISPVNGLLRHQAALNSWAEIGQVIANVVDLRGEVLAEIESPSHALVGHQRRWPVVEEGDKIATLLQEITDYSRPALAS